MATTPTTAWVVQLKTGGTFTVSGDELQVEWPLVKILASDGKLRAAWFNDNVAAVYPSDAVITPPTAVPGE